MLEEGQTDHWGVFATAVLSSADASENAVHGTVRLCNLIYPVFERCIRIHAERTQIRLFLESDTRCANVALRLTSKLAWLHAVTHRPAEFTSCQMYIVALTQQHLGVPRIYFFLTPG